MICFALETDTSESSGLLTPLLGTSSCNGWSGLRSQAFCHVIPRDRKVWEVIFGDMFVLLSACFGTVL